jgi:hypothetical protein
MKILYKITPLEFALLFCSSFLLAACGATSPGKLGTPSGRPEVTIPNTNIQTVMDNIASWLAAQGRPILETSVYTISASIRKPAPFLAGVGGYYYNTCVYTIVQNGINVEVYETMSGGGEVTGQSYYEDMQKELTQITEFIKTRSTPEVTK